MSSQHEIVTCPECHGSGKEYSQQHVRYVWCFLCSGEGTVRSYVADVVRGTKSNAMSDLADIVGYEEDTWT